MKTKILTGSILSLALSVSAYASTQVDLQMALTVNGQSFQPRVMTELGKAARVTQTDDRGDGIEITVTPTNTEASQTETGIKQTVFIDFVVSKISHGRKSVLAEPSVVVLDGNQARVAQRLEDGTALALDVLPTLSP